MADVRTVEEIVGQSLAIDRFSVLLFASFGALGLLLAAVGIYGVMAFGVDQRTQEFGVRMALGATTGRIQYSVLMSTLRLALVGVAVGTIVSVASARLISSLLFATSPWDAVTYASMALALVSVALVSGYLPALRASRTSPMTALRSD